jgi:hypothetical protein
MNLVEAGIVLKCLCGAGMNSDMVNVLFDDRGRVKIGRQSIRCPACGAIYRYGERIKYQLVPMDIKTQKEHDDRRRYIRRKYANHPEIVVPG